MKDLIQILIIAIVLSLDAFSVAIALGIKSKKHTFKEATIISLYFGGFQALMPLIGWVAGNLIKENFRSITNWVAFILLGIVGSKMIYENLRDKENNDYSLSTSSLVTLAIATSIDALIVGTTLAFIKIPLIFSIILIGIVTIIISLGGYYLGRILGKSFGKRVEIIGGVCLILLGIKFLLF